MAAKHPIMYVRISESEQKKFKDLRKHGFSAREILEIIAGKCPDFPITVISKTNGASIEIPRNILCQKKR
jgi:hypothetical protein